MEEFIDQTAADCKAYAAGGSVSVGGCCWSGVSSGEGEEPIGAGDENVDVFCIDSLIRHLDVDGKHTEEDMYGVVDVGEVV